VSLFQIRHNITHLTFELHYSLDTESVISILESTFKYRPDESQGGLIEEKIQMLRLFDCYNVNHSVVRQYLSDNADCYVVKYDTHGDM
jgi:hypothetical protein